jgi:hypothetical protein
MAKPKPAINPTIASAVVALSRKNPHDVPPSASGTHSEFQFAQLNCNYDPDDHAFSQNLPSANHFFTLSPNTSLTLSKKPLVIGIALFSLN